MTTQLPRPIEPGEALRKGWRVRAQRTMHGTVSATYEFTVDYEVRVGERVYAKDSGPHGLSFDRPDYSWLLLAEAPTPAPVVGSGIRMFGLVRDTDVSGVSGTGMVAEGIQFTDGSCAMRWLTETASTAVYASIADVETIHGHGGATRIVWIAPIRDHGDGCSPWPRGADGEPRCDEQMDNLTCSRERDHDGFHAAYGSVGDAHPYLVWAGGERVASWSERGQANG